MEIVEKMGTFQGLGGEAMYCVIVAWLSIVSWIIFSCVDDDDDAGRRLRKRRPPSAPAVTATGRRGARNSKSSPLF